MRIAIATGGTGGHFFPSLAVARELRGRGGEAVFLIGGHHVGEQVELAKESGFAAFPLRAQRVPGTPLACLSFTVSFTLSVVAALWTLLRIRPEMVVGMGSFASVPAALAACILRIPLILHEGNSHIGRANRFLSRWSCGFAFSLPLAPGQSHAGVTRRVGMPLRKSLIDAAAEPRPVEEILPEYNLSPGKSILLVFGGSQGASFLNSLVPGALEALDRREADFQVIHLTGRDDNTTLSDAYRSAGTAAWVKSFDSDIQNCYLMADLVICRSGACTISELALFGKPAVLVPFPESAEGHQQVNASIMAQAGCCFHLPQSQATPGKVAELLRSRLEDPVRWQEYAERMGEQARPDAATRMVDFIYDIRSE